MKTPNRPGSQKAQRKVKASSLKNIEEKGCEPRKALPSKKMTEWKDEIRSFVKMVPIGGSTPIGPRTLSWQNLGTNYICGLAGPGTRKSMEPITKRILDKDYQRMQQFITDSPWDPKDTLNRLIILGRDHIACSEGVIIIDDTGLKKRGKMSPGVAPQYFSETKETANCQRIVTCVYALPIGPTNADILTWPLGMKMIIPEEWDEDPHRREKAGIPTEVGHKLIWKYALDLIEKVVELDLPLKCVIADTDYGRVREFREQLQEWGLPYIMSVRQDKLNFIFEDAPIIWPEDVNWKGGKPRTKNYLPKSIKVKSPIKMAERIAKWNKARWGEGTKGPLEALFSRERVRTVKWKYPSHEIGWLLLEDGSEGTRAYICWGLDDLTLVELAKIAHCRWAIEEYHKHLKNRVGFSHFEGRKYRGWLHHSVLTQMAYAILQWMRWKHRGSDEDVPLPTLPEVQKILVSVIFEMLMSEHRSCELCRTCPIRTWMIEAG